MQKIGLKICPTICALCWKGKNSRKTKMFNLYILENSKMIFLFVNLYFRLIYLLIINSNHYFWIDSLIWLNPKMFKIIILLWPPLPTASNVLWILSYNGTISFHSHSDKKSQCRVKFILLHIFYIQTIFGLLNFIFHLLKFCHSCT